MRKEAAILQQHNVVKEYLLVIKHQVELLRVVTIQKVVALQQVSRETIQTGVIRITILDIEVRLHLPTIASEDQLLHEQQTAQGAVVPLGAAVHQ
jgi:hypothetical protein